MADEGQVQLSVVPVTMAVANDYVRQHHRHHKPDTGHKFSIGVVDQDGTLRGVAIVGRPKARHFDDKLTAEVTRVATDGTPNACSALYGAAWRTAKGMGYLRLVTYTQEGESGASLRGAGWAIVGERAARPGWADSSVALKEIRDPVGTGGVARVSDATAPHWPEGSTR